MSLRIGPAAFAVLAMAALGATSSALAQAAGPQSYSANPRSGPHLAYGSVCDRAAIRDCQAHAQFRMKLCDPFPGRLACADRILAEQSACFAATGCD